MTNKKDRLTFLYWDEPIWKEKPTKQNKNEDNTTRKESSDKRCPTVSILSRDNNNKDGD
jgi:hypothetical protein